MVHNSSKMLVWSKLSLAKISSSYKKRDLNLEFYWIQHQNNPDRDCVCGALATECATESAKMSHPGPEMSHIAHKHLWYNNPARNFSLRI